MIEISTNTISVPLNGTEERIRFVSAYPYFWVRNDGAENIYISVYSDISEGKDGVIEIPAGSSAGTMHGIRKHNLYVKGNGKVQTMGTVENKNPFKQILKGGDNSNSGTLFSIGLYGFLPPIEDVLISETETEE